MADSVALACQCGKVTGSAALRPLRQRVVCYCKDCQAFAHYLARQNDVLDDWGGSDIVQITPSQLHIESGANLIQAVRLGPKGLYRFHTTCCNTPIANAVSAGMAFHGVLSAMVADKSHLDEQLGQVDYYVHGKEAQGKPAHPAVHPTFPVVMMLTFLTKLAWYRLTGRHQPSPFFDQTGQPVVPINVLSKAEREAVTPRTE